MSKWISKCGEAYSQKGALFETLDIDWFSMGFGSYITHRSAISNRYVNKERFDYRIYYKGKLFD